MVYLLSTKPSIEGKTHTSPAECVCVENRLSHALLLKPGHASEDSFTVKEIAFVVCGVLG